MTKTSMGPRLEPFTRDQVIALLGVYGAKLVPTPRYCGRSLLSASRRSRSCSRSR
jgi:hypothetical protein